MSRAFVNEDAAGEPDPKYSLPDRDSEYYDAAAARALIDGAHAGNRRSAEQATGYAWGDPALVAHVREILDEARSLGDDRTMRLCQRYLRAAEPDA